MGKSQGRNGMEGMVVVGMAIVITCFPCLVDGANDIIKL